LTTPFSSAPVAVSWLAPPVVAAGACAAVVVVVVVVVVVAAVVVVPVVVSVAAPEASAGIVPAPNAAAPVAIRVASVEGFLTVAPFCRWVYVHPETGRAGRDAAPRPDADMKRTRA
jgi:hypothetical protein